MRSKANAKLLPFVSFALDQRGNSPLHRQLFEHVRQTIVFGRLPSGTRMPSSRSLAGELACSRNTVIRALEELLAEGYLEGRERSGIFVAKLLPEQFFSAYRKLPQPQGSDTAMKLSKRGQRLARAQPLQYAHHVPFEPSRPDVLEFPFAVWTKLTAQCWRKPDAAVVAEIEPGGHIPLREEIARYAREARGIECDYRQVVITNGAQHGTDLAARLLLDSGEQVWVEDPGYPGVRMPLEAAGARLTPIPVDAEGISVETGRRIAPQARMVSVSPSHQFPTGVEMSLPRRLELLRWAETENAWILEDDYDGEFRFSGPSQSALFNIDGGQRVIYVGTFSKMLFPAIRLGFLIVPRHIARDFAHARSMLDLQPSILAQPVLARFMGEGHFAEHIRRMRVIYRQRQQALRAMLAAHFPGLLEASGDDAGLHLLARFAGRYAATLDDRQVAECLARRGLITPPLSSYRIDRVNGRALLLGYGAFGVDAIKQGVETMARAIAEDFS